MSPLHHFTSPPLNRLVNYRRLPRPFYHPFNSQANPLDLAPFNEKVLRYVIMGNSISISRGFKVKAPKLIVTNRQLFQVSRIEIDPICSFVHSPGGAASSV